MEKVITPAMRALMQLKIARQMKENPQIRKMVEDRIMQQQQTNKKK